MAASVLWAVPAHISRVVTVILKSECSVLAHTEAADEGQLERGSEEVDAEI